MAQPMQGWIAANPSVHTWYDKIAKGSKNTAKVYASNLWKYWREVLQPRGFKQIDQWAHEVAEQQKSDDVQVKRRWGKDLENYILSSRLMRASRFVRVQAIKSFLSEHMELANCQLP